MKFLRSATVWSAMLVSIAGCAPGVEASAVVVTFSGCGQAFDGAVAGVAVGPGLVVTVAHAVIQGDRFLVEEEPAEVVALDRRSDLALLQLAAAVNASAVRLGTGKPGDEVRIVGGLTTPDASGEVVATPMIRIPEVLGTDRVGRRGLELRADLDEGDSGAGIFDSDRRLVGVVFAVNDDRDGVAWGVAASEIETLMAADRGPWDCVQGDSRLRQPQP